MKIARVFPRKTSMTPDDKDAYVGLPTLFTPHYDEIHISITFTWDLFKVDFLKKNWERYGKIKVGGPAFNPLGSDFTSGMYLKKGVTITSRGCPNNCSFCFVPKREGKIRELPIVEGNSIQDNNLLACSKQHIQKVFKMLRTQKHIEFAGGLESSKVTDRIIEQLRGLHIYQLWVACDYPTNEKKLIKVVNKLSKYFSRDKIRCYVLIGYKKDTLNYAEHRLKRAWEIGTLPFAMLYKDKDNTPHSIEWRQFQRKWSRPAIIRTRMKGELCKKKILP